MALRRFALLILVISLSAIAAPEPAPTPEEAFTQLMHLVGRWTGKFPDGRAHSVSYTLTAGGTVLQETWALAPGRESLTLYHIDGDDLIATHYCPQGNQPRLRYVRGNEPGKLSFAFRDGTNLQVKGRSHQHSFWMKLVGDNSFVRSETYVENGTAPSIVAAEPEEVIIYTRAR
ncbi:MAG: hypothetical protein ACHQPI_08885 [Thermoanaerobaculia bacterium]